MSADASLGASGKPDSKRFTGIYEKNRGDFNSGPWRNFNNTSCPFRAAASHGADGVQTTIVGADASLGASGKPDSKRTVEIC